MYWQSGNRQFPLIRILFPFIVGISVLQSFYEYVNQPGFYIVLGCLIAFMAILVICKCSAGFYKGILILVATVFFQPLFTAPCILYGLASKLKICIVAFLCHPSSRTTL